MGDTTPVRRALCQLDYGLGIETPEPAPGQCVGLFDLGEDCVGECGDVIARRHFELDDEEQSAINE